jgi:hypothetical protein
MGIWVGSILRTLISQSILNRPSNISYHTTRKMSSTQTPSVIASVYRTEVNGPPSEIATVKGLPSVCSIATLQETAQEPVMTSSDSLDPRSNKAGISELVLCSSSLKSADIRQAQPDEEPNQDTDSETPYWRHAVNGIVTAGVFVGVHEGQRLYFKHGNREIRDAEERKDKEDKELADALSLAATAGREAKSEED